MTALLDTPVADGDLYRWDRMGSLPRRGWSLVHVEDLGEPAHECDACGYPALRYVHHLEHTEALDDLAVGCICAEHLTEDYTGPRAAERMLRNRQARLRRLLDLERWHLTRDSNRKIKYRGRWIVLYAARYADGWRINVGEMHGRKTHPTPEAAIKAAFRYLDPPVIQGALVDV
jgi:hypothetical protein